MFHKQNINFVNECVRARFELANIQSKLKAASETKRLGDITTSKICKDPERLLKKFEIIRRKNEHSIQDIKETIESISNKKEIVDKNVFNQICRFVKRSLTVDIADYTPVYSKKHRAKILSELLDYLLKCMTSIQQQCEEVDSLVSTVMIGLTNYINSTNKNTASSAEELTKSMIVEINTLQTSLSYIELRAREISKSSPDFNNKPIHN